jgi:hypothetical protein
VRLLGKAALRLLLTRCIGRQTLDRHQGGSIRHHGTVVLHTQHGGDGSGGTVRRRLLAASRTLARPMRPACGVERLIVSFRQRCWLCFLVRDRL